MLVFGQAVFLLPSPPHPHKLPSDFSPFKFVQRGAEIEFASLNFPPSHKTASYAVYEVA